MCVFNFGKFTSLECGICTEMILCKVNFGQSVISVCLFREYACGKQKLGNLKCKWCHFQHVYTNTEVRIHILINKKLRRLKQQKCYFKLI
jgi:hypothetical protein